MSSAVWSQTLPAADDGAATIPAQLVTADPDAASAGAEAEKAAQAAEARLEQVRANLAAVKEIIEIGLDSDKAGELLREARGRAPDIDAVQQRVVKRGRDVAEAKLDRVRLLERLRLTESPTEAARLKAELATQEAYLASLSKAYAAQTELASQTRQLLDLLDARLLWIGSAPAIGPAWAADVASDARWFGDPLAWIDAGTTLLRRLAQTWLLSLLMLAIFAALVFSRSRLKARLPALAANVNRHATDSFVLTIRAAVVTLLLSVAVPVALGGIGLLLASQTLDLFANAVGSGLLAAAAVYLLLNFFRQLCRPDGLADVHFGWNASARQTLSRNLRWLLAVTVPASFLVAMCDAGGSNYHRQGLGRLAFLVGSTGLTIFVARVFRPGSGVFRGLLDTAGWAWRLRKLWYGLLVLLPALLTLAAAVGYYYTATEVQSRFFTTGVVVVGGIVIYSLMTRWLLVTRRRLAIQQAKQKLAEQREARKKEAANPDEPAAARPELDLQSIDIGAASVQTLALLRTVVAVAVLAALWAVWKNILPALSILESVELTTKTQDGNGAVLVAPITLWSLLVGLIALVLTGLAARNLPAMLELAILQRFPLDAGIRYAASTLARYFVIAVGLIVASNVIGIDWSRAQWIIAALGVGLGFGLQEIVANFVSGLIILFERPVRVGDTVTVGDVSGVVSRLQIRATTITDWDNKEVLVPNKSFITDRVVNWTLSSSTTRLLVPVGIAYGSDIAKAHAAITAAVKSVPAVLDDPKPTVLFVGFGDSSLNFEVRVFVGELLKRLPTVHDLHVAIDAALRDAEIEIPFPQRDLHLRSSDITFPIAIDPRQPDEA